MSRMTTRLSVFVALASAGILLAGCAKKDDASATTADSAAAPVPSAPAPVTTAPAPVPTHVPPVTTTVVTNASIDSCCSALAAISKSGRDKATKDKAKMSAAVCSGIAPKVKNGTTPRAAALTQVKSGMVGATVPPECN